MMPLERGNTRSAIGDNIRTELAAGKPRKQAIAIALHTARDSMKATKKGASLKKVGNIHAGFGHVASVRMGSEYSSDGLDDSGMAEVAVHHGPKPKPPKNNARGGLMATGPYKEKKISRVHIPHEEARELKIGDRVRVTLHKHSS
jgi:hypothetical protein